ncbi:type II secretion system protein GspD [Flagellimonas sp. CMM7]|uniref:type II secretion system protein GspD n=1 Tax=Flagellimonas sp. CMM7 TaxID=2654676 RepID=UPI001F30461D|nr:type II and III secretion system protein [Flagellimonas sp. CMM7]UII80126.1 type II and III secretion system protein [Flagellimonas sp. CMM7]
MKNYLIHIFFFLIAVSGFAQSDAENLLVDYATEHEELSETITIDISGLTIYEFLNSVALEHKINLSVDSDLTEVIESSFFEIPVKDVFLFIVNKFDLELSIVNNIIVFSKKEIEREVMEAPKPKEIEASYNDKNDFLSIKLSNESLEGVAKKITDISGKNLVIGPSLKDKQVSAYILNRPFEQVVEMMAKSNQMVLTIDENGFYYLEKDTTPTEQTGNQKTKGNGLKSLASLESSAEIKVEENGFISIKAFDADITALITKVAEQLNVNYFMYNRPDGLTTTFVSEMITFDDLLDHVFKGKPFTYKKTGDFYLIGDQNVEGLRNTELIQLENRTIETVLETLPKDLLENVEIKEFFELNGFVISGSRPRILEIKEYIKEIDVVVPMILIEVLIVQYQKSSEVQTGLQAGLDNEPRTTAGVLFPTTDVSLNSTSVNSLVDAFNGFGIFNLGKVTENFYLNLRTLENNSVINLKSTPKISTLNGHDAKLSIGETSYYFEQNNRLINSGLGNDILQSGQWKSTDANLSVNIRPFVSKDEQITLNILVERSTFLGRQGENAPPGKATQQFESLVRCLNGEMILLGGLDELDKENSGTGTPGLSKVPVLKWFFSSRRKSNSKSKLHVFIKPTVVY